MTNSNDEEDASILERWMEFRDCGEMLGYKRVSYDYSGKWLPVVRQEPQGLDAAKLQRRLHA